MTERTSLWVLRGLALTIAVALWFFLTYDKRELQSDRVITASVTYEMAGERVVLDPIEQVQVRLRGPSRVVRSLAPFQVNVVVEVPPETESPLQVTLSRRNVYAPEGLEVTSIEPRTLELAIDDTTTIQLPVEVLLTGEPAAGATVGTPVSNPPFVTVSGPESRLENLDRVATQPVSLDGHATTFEERVDLESPEFLVSLEPLMVQVRVPLDPPRLSEEAEEALAGNGGGAGGRP